jgi:hypothetical protein
MKKGKTMSQSIDDKTYKQLIGRSLRTKIQGTTATPIRITKEDELKTIQKALADLRGYRDLHPFGKIRSLYNTICDRLDVLESKIINSEEKQ